MSLITGIMDLSAAAGRIAHSLASPADKIKNQVARSVTTPAAPGSTVTSNDFLQLLVTEMKNQDPTQPTDPNAYIQQLVGVNSLQQLIAINNDLTPQKASTAAVGVSSPNMGL